MFNVQKVIKASSHVTICSMTNLVYKKRNKVRNLFVLLTFLIHYPVSFIWKPGI